MTTVEAVLPALPRAREHPHPTHAPPAQARERKKKAQEALRISELEISLCKWQRRLHEMERRLESCEETEVKAARAPPAHETTCC